MRRIVVQCFSIRLSSQQPAMSHNQRRDAQRMWKRMLLRIPIHVRPALPSILSPLSASFGTSLGPIFTHSLHQMHRQRPRHSTTSRWHIHPHSNQPKRSLPRPTNPSKRHELSNRDPWSKHLLSSPRSPHFSLLRPRRHKHISHHHQSSE